MLRLLGIAVCSVAALQACSSEERSARPVDAEEVGPARATGLEHLVAYAKSASLPVFDAPGRREPKLQLENPLPSGAPRALLVTKDRGAWLKVLLPIRPNGSTGWVRDADVKLFKHTYRIVVDLDEHHLTVYHGAKVFMSAPVAIGTEVTPTPVGEYYTIELLRQPDPGGDYGPYAYGLSGYSEVLTEFAGGDGELGLHGTNEPQALGTDVSAGCIRLSNENILKLAEVLPLGTPINVVA